MAHDKPLFVSDVREALSKYPSDTEMIFGSTVFGQHSLAFVRFNTVTTDEVILELADTSTENRPNEYFAEVDHRMTVEGFLRHLAFAEDTDKFVIGPVLGGNAPNISLRDIAPVVSLNVVQRYHQG